MSDLSPESASARDAGSPAGYSQPEPDSPVVEPWFAAPTEAPAVPGPYGTQALPARPVRRFRGPLIGFVAGAVVVALGLGGYLIARNVSASKANKPVATSSHAKAGGITVSGHGITMSFPSGWVNVPTSPNQFQQFIKDFEKADGKIPAALQAEANDPQALSTFAMLVFHQNGTGGPEENFDALVAPLGPAPSEMVADLESGQGPSQFGATDVHYSVTKFGQYPGVLVTYTLRVSGITEYGAQSYLNGSSSTVVSTVTSQDAATSKADLLQIVATVRFT